jgi:hypothetical protein
VPEERPLGQARTLGDLRHRRVLEAMFGEQRVRCLLQPAASVRFPSRHAFSLFDDSD